MKNYSLLVEKPCIMRNQRIAILDLGTNTFYLLIADVANGLVQNEILKEYLPVKLGEGGINKGHITQEAFERGIAAINQFNVIIKQYKADQIKAVATSAIRSADNGNDFINWVKSETGIEIEIIEGDREAELIFQGVNAAVKLNNDIALIVDIGGGSVEFIICNFKEIFWKKSYPIGAARLMESYHNSDPISEKDIQAIDHYLDQNLSELKQQCALLKPELLIGSAGAFETFAELVTDQFGLPKENLAHSEFSFNQEQLDIIFNNLLQSSHSERSVTAGIIPLRVDMIIVATVLTRYIIRQLKIKTIKLSAYSLKEGVLFDLLK